MPKKSLAEWEDIHGKFYSKYSGLKKWQDANYKEVCNNGSYQSFTGRWYKFHKEESGSYSRPAVCNYIVQGTATGDIVPFAMMLIRKRLRDEEVDAKIICQVHDSVVMDVHKDSVEAAAFIIWDVFNKLPTSIRQYWGYNWCVPMSGCVEVGKNYKELVEIYNKKGRV